MTLIKKIKKQIEGVYICQKYEKILSKNFVKTKTRTINDKNIFIDVYEYEIEVYSSKKYDEIVSTLIREKYSNNDVEAIFANYLSDKENTKYINEFNTFQEYRENCKKEAKLFISKRTKMLNEKIKYEE